MVTGKDFKDWDIGLLFPPGTTKCKRKRALLQLKGGCPQLPSVPKLVRQYSSETIISKYQLTEYPLNYAIGVSELRFYSQLSMNRTSHFPLYHPVLLAKTRCLHSFPRRGICVLEVCSKFVPPGYAPCP